MEEIIRFVMLAQSARFTVSELCEQFGISRKTGYKHLERYAADGLKGLAVRSHRPHQFPQRTDTAVEALILAERRRHRTWGPKKLHKVLEVKHGLESPPARSTIGEILRRHGLTVPTRPNQVWTVDFKGWFLLGNGQRCDPLTVCDRYSRYLLACRAHLGTNYTSLPEQRALAYSWEMQGGGWVWWWFVVLPYGAAGDGGSTASGWRAFLVAFVEHGVVTATAFKSPSTRKSLHEHMYAWEKTLPARLQLATAP